MTSGQETERVYSYNPGASTGSESNNNIQSNSFTVASCCTVMCIARSMTTCWGQWLADGTGKSFQKVCGKVKVSQTGEVSDLLR